MRRTRTPSSGWRWCGPVSWCGPSPGAIWRRPSAAPRTFPTSSGRKAGAAPGPRPASKGTLPASPEERIGTGAGTGIEADVGTEAGIGIGVGVRASVGREVRAGGQNAEHGRDAAAGPDANAGRDAGRTLADLFVALPLAAVDEGDPDAMAAIVHLHDDEASRGSARYRGAWNGVLRLFNLLQFLPAAWWTTRRGARSGLYPEFAPAAGGPAAPGPEAETGLAPPPPGEGWEESIGLAAPGLRPLLAELSERGMPVPEVGFELAGDGGAVVAEAELAWPDRRIAVLLPEPGGSAAAFAAAGWRVLESDDDHLCGTIAGALAGEDR